MAGLPEAEMKKVVWTPDVYEPSDDSFALVDASVAWLQKQSQADAQLPRVCLEVGCGSGYVICSVALALKHLYSLQQQQQHPQQQHLHQQTMQHNQQQRQQQKDQSVQQAAAEALGSVQQQLQCKLIATDINPAALAATARTLAAHGVHDVELVQTDLVTALLPRLAGAVDLLLFNPPYVPTPDEEVVRDGIARAWAGGHLGRRVTDRLLPLLPELLSAVGHAFIVTVPENRPQEIMGVLEGLGLSAEVALTRSADEECLQILHVQRMPTVLNEVQAEC